MTGQAWPEFTDPAGLRRARGELRERLRVMHGLPADARMRVRAGAFTLDVLLGGQWVPFTASMPDAEDRVRMSPVGPFRLRLTGRLHP